MIKKLLLSLFGLLSVLAILIAFWASSTVPFSQNEQAIIDEEVASNLTNTQYGQEGFTQSADMNIWYRTEYPSATHKPIKGTVLLIQGLGASSMFWPDEILTPLLQAGYQVIISDHRGLGNSDWHSEEYNLSDLMQDNLAVLDALKIKKAHVLGLSLGGMIGQEMALQFPQRVVSLNSIMSSGFTEDPDFPVAPWFKPEAVKLLIRFGLVATEENTVKMMVGIYKLLKGDSDIDVRHIARATLKELRQRKGFNHQLADQQAEAIHRSGSRYARLPDMIVPTLVVHGEKDPLVNVLAAKKYAALIPKAKTLWVAGMGHGLEPQKIDIWMKSVVEFINENNQS